MNTKSRRQCVWFVLTVYLLFALEQKAGAATWYVATNGNDSAAGTSWGTAKQTIQSGVDRAANGDSVLVSNGVYAAGARVTPGGSLTNRVVITNNIFVKSVNGPSTTTIQGQGPIGTNAVRCVFMTNGCHLVGFTLTNGSTMASGDSDLDQSAGGAYADGGVLTNCVLTGNSAYYYGGGACYGTLNNCTLTNNSATDGGGAYDGTLANCTLSGNSATDYGDGGGACDGTLTNCTLTGNSAYDGGGAYESTLKNCTLTANSATDGGGGAFYGEIYNCTLTGNSAAYSGGGVCVGALVKNCTLTANSAGNNGGGVYNTTLEDCALTGNSAVDGGGACGGTLYNCTLTRNSATDGGGAFNTTLNNCIVYFNTAPTGSNYDNNCALNYCCTTPMPAGGANNITGDPQLITDWRIAASSPCRGAGSLSYTNGVDMDGETWLNPPSIGCDEIHGDALTGALQVSISATTTQAVVNVVVPFTGIIQGRAASNKWDFSDGTVVFDTAYPNHAWSSVGTYPVVLTAYNSDHPGGVSATVNIQVLTAAASARYVAINSPSPAPPYTNWSSAAHTIQEAVDAQTALGGSVIVADGTYSAGGRVTPGGSLTNRVVITNNITLQSLNGPLTTTIQGQGPKGSNAVRCVFMTSGLLSGFTLANGSTLTNGDYFLNQSGGGVYASGVALANCVLTGNSAALYGGGACYGTLNNCTLSGNSAPNGGGVYNGILTNCTLVGNSAPNHGGGVCIGILNNCTLTNNSTVNNGGGAENATLNNCTLSANRAGLNGGGASDSTLNNCTLTGNVATNSIGGGFGGSGGGEYNSTLNNCTLTGNVGYFGGGASYGTLNNCTLTGNSAIVAGGGETQSTLNNCTLTGNSAPAGNGGGVCYGVLNNCTLTGNWAFYGGGGTWYGLFNHCTLSGNFVTGGFDTNVFEPCQGGAAQNGTLNNCTITGNSAPDGGGTWNATLSNCVVSGNWAWSCGGADLGTLNNCLVIGNTATNYCGGVGYADLNNCLVTGNSAPSCGGAGWSTLRGCTVAGNSASTDCGGTTFCTLYDSIIYFNTAPTSPNFGATVGVSYCCTTPAPQVGSGSNNITSDPQFADAAGGNYRLKPTSPCINKGNNSYDFVRGSTDLDGKSRIAHGVVDMGAYEFGGFSGWTAAITNGLTNYDQCATGDGYPNLLKYATGSSPTQSDTLARINGMLTTNKTFALQFHRNPGASDVTLIVEGAYALGSNALWTGITTNADGSGWNPTNVTETGSGSPVTVTVQDNTSPATNRFFRLLVTMP